MLMDLVCFNGGYLRWWIGDNSLLSESEALYKKSIYGVMAYIGSLMQGGWEWDGWI